jgi:hypothetical protein
MRPLGVGLTIQAATTAYASEPSIAHVKPILGNFAGYEFEWGPMIAGLLACFAVRFYVSKTEEEHQWTIDAPVTALTLLFTAAIIQSQRPIPLIALFYGTGLGAFGVGIIRVALSFVRRTLGDSDDDEHDQPKPPAA